MITKLIEVEEYHRLISLLHGRDRLIVELLASTGLRVSELVQLKRGDIDLEAQLIRLNATKTKTQTYREVIIPAPLVPDLKRYMDQLEGEYLFPGQGKPHVTSQRIRQIIHDGAVKAGIQVAYRDNTNGKRNLWKVTPHTLRSFHAVHSLDCGVPISDLQSQLGHSSLASTSRYLEAGINHRRESYKKFKF